MITTEFRTFRQIPNCIIFTDFVDNQGCEADDFEQDMNVGNEVTFNGCEVTTTVSDDSELSRDQYTLMTLWQQVSDYICRQAKKKLNCLSKTENNL